MADALSIFSKTLATALSGLALFMSGNLNLPAPAHTQPASVAAAISQPQTASAVVAPTQHKRVVAVAASPAAVSTLPVQNSGMLRGLTAQEVDARIAAAAQALRQQFSSSFNPGYGSPFNNVYIPSVIDNLSDVHLNGDTIATNLLAASANVTNLTVSGSTSFGALNVSGATAFDVLSATGHIDVPSNGASGYYMDGHPLINASSTTLTLLFGWGNGGTNGLGQSMNSGAIRNTVMGYNALFSATQATENTAIGYSAGSGVISANANSFFGYEAGATCKYCSYATAIGFQAFSTQMGSTSTDHPDDDLTVAVGAFAMGNTTYQRYGTAIGVQALQNSASSTYDVAVGYQAMNNFNSNTTSSGLNTAIGAKSMRLAGSGAENTALGWLSQQNVTGSYNTCAGSTCFGDLTSGVYNTAIGYFAGTTQGGSNPSGASMLTGTSSIFIGDYSGLNATGLNIQYSAAIGSHATVGSSNAIVLGGRGTYGANVGIGTSSPYAKLSVQVNTADNVAPTTLLALTYGTGLSTTTPFAVTNTAVSIGSGVSIDISAFSSYKQNSISILYASSTKASIFGGETGGISTFSGVENTAFGHAALDRLTTGTQNTAFGMRAGFVLTTGTQNVAIGNRALATATSSSGSTAVGQGALMSVSNAAGDTTGVNNTAVGFSALNLSTSGAENTAVGYNSMGAAVVTGSRNTAIGLGSLSALTSGIRNTAIGYGAINGLNTGSNNVAIGFSTGGITGGSGNIIIGGNGITMPLTNGSNQLDIGNLIYGANLDGTGLGFSTGTIGIASTTPWAKLSVAGSPAGTIPVFTVSTSTVSATSTAFIIDSNGKAGVATSSPWRSLSVTGTVGFDGLTGTTGAGSLCLSANKEIVFNSGSDACLSSTRATKHDIRNLSVSATDMIAALQPVSFIYNNDASSTVRYGFIAEDTAAVDDHLATHDAHGVISGIDDRSILSVLVLAFKDITHNVAALTSTVAGFAHELVTHRVVTEDLCAKTSGGETVCVTGNQLAEMLRNGGGTSIGSGSSEDTDAPVITVTGNNPAHINVGDTYMDLGATVEDNVDHNLGIHAYVDGTPLDQFTFDTSAPITYTIDYTATDSAGNSATTTRTVIVELP